ncbi:hypothetical protein TDB9533_03691 [Thalassocella blandensis]|nr:hypothetical protein TDB9533_03691 [Thalassocella blandensis]
MTLIQSSEFRRHKLSHDVTARQNRGYVFLISRFDDDDSTMCTFGSMGYRDEAIKSGIGGVAPVTLASIKKSTKVKPTDVKHTNFADKFQEIGKNRVVVTNTQQGGAHAEELFLRKLPQMFDEYGEPRKIDIFVSRIPCASTSANWVLNTEKGKVLLPQGCANKLLAVIQSNPGITWRIWWEEEYPNPNTQTACASAMAKLSGRAIVKRY